MRTWKDFTDSKCRPGDGTRRREVQGQNRNRGAGFVRLIAPNGVCAAACLLAASASIAAGQTISDRYPSGVRHIITASMGVDLHYRKTLYGNAKNEAVTVYVRISDHARESQFYGQVTVPFSDFVGDGLVPEREIWKDAGCHQRRGLPKMTVFLIEGSITDDLAQIQAIAARSRPIGLLVPVDEVMAGAKLPGGRDKIGPFMATRTRTPKPSFCGPEVVQLELQSLRRTAVAG